MILQNRINEPACLNGPILALSAGKGHSGPDRRIVKGLSGPTHDALPDLRYPRIQDPSMVLIRKALLGVQDVLKCRYYLPLVHVLLTQTRCDANAVDIAMVEGMANLITPTTLSVTNLRCIE